MANLPLTNDAAFLTLVHELMDSEHTTHATQRGSPRSAFPSWQRMAPWTGDRVPSAADFREMRCFDISASGLAFLSPVPFDHRQLVVALGTDHPTYLAAEVVHQTAMTLVGCRFTQRLPS